MRIAVLRIGGKEQVALRRGDGLVPVSALGLPLPTELGAFLAQVAQGVDTAELAAALEAAPSPRVVGAAEARRAAPIAHGAKILCLGLNYVDHAQEASYARPEHPVVFSRFAQSFVGPDEPLERPSSSELFDYESELVAVIGRAGRRIPRERALEHVLGYTLMNDGSVRDVQTRTHQWMLGKNFDRSGSVGPEIVTADELPPGASGLALSGRLNGQVMQRQSTSDMIFDVATTVAYLSEAMALAPGDLVAMGTPAGVGHARRPPVYMRAGDVFEVEVERLGVLRNPVRLEP